MNGPTREYSGTWGINKSDPEGWCKKRRSIHKQLAVHYGALKSCSERESIVRVDAINHQASEPKGSCREQEYDERLS